MAGKAKPKTKTSREPASKGSERAYNGSYKKGGSVKKKK